MTETVFGSGISPAPVPMPVAERPEGDPEPIPMPVAERPEEDPEPIPMPAVSDEMNALRALIQQDFNIAIADVERRLSQARELERSALHGESRSVHAEDLNISRHLIDGYTKTANSPSSGSIAWANLHVVLLGVDYTIADGNTASKYAWFVKPASGTSATLQTGNVLPALGAGDALIFVNDNGNPISALESSVSYAVGSGVIGDEQVSSLSQNKISGLATAFDGIGTDLERIEAKADGAITQHFGPNFPWANGSAQDASKTGDVYTAQSSTDEEARPNGRSWKWSGAGGSPANTWVLIEDSGLTKALADAAAAKEVAEGKTTVFWANSTDVPSATSIGDEWVVLNQSNKRKRATALGTGGWVDQLLGNDAIASGISGSKIGTGINGSNITTGTVAATRVGAGVNGAVLATATGQLTPAKLNTAFHMLY